MTAPGGRANAEIEGSSWLRVGRRYLAPLLVRRFPPEVPFGFVGRVIPTDAEVDLFLEAHRIPDDEAMALVDGARAVAEAELAGGAGDAAAELELERAAAESLGHAVAARTQELWKIGLRYVAVGSTRPNAEAERARLSERLAQFGFRTRVPRYEAAATLAGAGVVGADEARPAGFWQTLPTDGLAALFPFADETVLEPAGILVGLSLANASPVFLDRWSHASHSWGIFGTTGAGKSFAAALTVVRTRWLRPETELFLIDPTGEFAGVARALGGTVVRPAGGGSGERLNPLDPATTGGDRPEKAGRVAAMLRALFPSLRDEEAATLDAAVARLLERDGPAPTFDDLRAEVDRAPAPGRLPTLLDVFRHGPLAAVNGPTDCPLRAPVVAFDLSGIPADQLPFHLTYVLDFTYGRLRDRPGPKLVLLDEAHLLARAPTTADFLDRLVRRMRHHGAGLLLLSQSPDDFLSTESGRSLLRNLAATVFLRLPEVSADARAFFGLGVAEAEWLPKARMPRDAGYAESLWRIGGWHLPLAIVASTPEFDFLKRALGGVPPA